MTDPWEGREIEDRLRASLAQRSQDVTPGRDAWDRFQSRMAGQGRQWWRVLVPVAVVGLLVVAAAALLPPQRPRVDVAAPEEPSVSSPASAPATPGSNSDRPLEDIPGDQTCFEGAVLEEDHSVLDRPMQEEQFSPTIEEAVRRFKISRQTPFDNNVAPSALAMTVMEERLFIAIDEILNSLAAGILPSPDDEQPLTDAKADVLVTLADDTDDNGHEDVIIRFAGDHDQGYWLHQVVIAHRCDHGSPEETPIPDPPTQDPSLIPEPSPTAERSLMTVPSPTAVPIELELGPAMDIDDLAELPPGGVAIQVGAEAEAKVVFVDLDGVVLGHLPEANLPPTSWNRQMIGASVEASLLLQVDGSHLVVGPSGVQHPDELAWPMADGYRLVLRGGADTGLLQVEDPDGEVVYEFSADAEWRLDARHRVVSHLDDLQDSETPSAIAFDVLSGEVIPLPSDCPATPGTPAGLVYDRTDDGLVLVCWRRGDPSEDQAHFEARDWATVELLRPDGSTDLLLEPPIVENAPRPSGHYRWAAVSPDGRWLGGQHSGECEVPTAMYAPVGDLEPEPFVTSDGEGVSSDFHGWTSANQAVVSLLDGGCGSGYGVPGVYLVNPATGEPKLLWVRPMFEALTVVLFAGPT